jgi:hypothetical protein
MPMPHSLVLSLRLRCRPRKSPGVCTPISLTSLSCIRGPETQKIVKGLPMAMEYAERIHRRYFPDYTLWE